MHFSIRSRLLSVFIGLAVGPLLVAGSIIAAQSFATQQAQALTRQMHLAKRVVVEVQAFIEARENILEVIIQVQGLAELNQEQQQQVLEDVLTYQDLFQELTILDAAGQERIRTTRLAVAREPDLAMHVGQAEYEVPMTTATTYFSPITIDPISGEPWLTIAVPIPDKRAGGTQGVLVATLRAKRIWDIIANLSAETDESIYILDATGQVVAHRNPSVVLRNTTFTLPTQSGIGSGLEADQVVWATAPLVLGAQTWSVVVERPTAQALALSRNTVLVVGGGIVVGLALAGVVGMVVIRQIVRPLQKLATTARRIRLGDLAQHANILTDVDEISALTDAFNAMTTQVRISVEDLEQRVLELKHTQEKLRQLSSAVEQSADQVVITDTRGTIEYVNPAFEQLTEYRREEVIGQTPALLASGEQDAAFYERLWNTILSGAIFRGAIINRKKSGELYYAEKTISPIRDQSGVITHFVSTDKDVTERVRAEAALRESAARYRSIFENSAVGIFRSTPDGHFTIVNEALVRMLGYTTTAEVLALSLPDDLYFDATEQDRLRQTYDATGRMEGVEVRWKKGDGAVILVSIHARTLTDGAGQVMGYEGLVQEVTQRHLAEALLTLQKQVLELIVTNTPIVQVLLVLARSIETHVSRSFCSILLMDRDGQHLRSCISPSLPPSFAQAMDRLAIGPRARSCGAAAYLGETVISNDIATDPLWADCADWIISNYNLHASWSTPIFSRTRQVLGTFALYYPEAHTPTSAERELVAVSARLASLAIERQQAEDEIHLLNAELEQRVVERTTQLERANQELEAFSYSISHDLRAPVRALNGFASILLTEQLDHLTPEGRHYLQLVQTSAHRMGELIDDLLKFSRLSRQPIEKQTTDLVVLVWQVWDDLSVERDQRQIEFTVETLPACQGDPALLRQVLLNLLSNALKFTRTRAVANIQVASRHESGEDVYFVRDNGVGFDQRYAHRLFGVFQRLHTEAEFEGTGVGLALVQRILHRHGGRIWVEAEVEQGATFYFTV